MVEKPPDEGKICYLLAQLVLHECVNCDWAVAELFANSGRAARELSSLHFNSANS